ncbi:hypothetical protein PDJAM_G00225610 [Pangasius djambal]|uniref:Uncharacterized protein n=1 Tax=Pangasius djambal TaxID=1691987 RepID=A0ACC5YDL1_9TELE|nr:hypothetical protein [Pangasius djambal]
MMVYQFDQLGLCFDQEGRIFLAGYNNEIGCVHSTFADLGKQSLGELFRLTLWMWPCLCCPVAHHVSVKSTL